LRLNPKSRPFRQEHYRWMREGAPNFDDRVFQRVSELELIARKDVKRVYTSTPIIRALEEMAHSYRSLVVVKAGDYFAGLLTTMKVVNYLGGGELFRIVETRHNFNVFSALSKEPVETIMEANPVIAFIDEDVRAVLTKMVTYGVGIVPIVSRDWRVIGVVTEHDFVKYLTGAVSIGLKAQDVMSSPVVTVREDQTLKEAMETMVKYGFRRVPVVTEDGVVTGILTAVDVVRGFGTHELLERAVSGDIREVLSTPVTDLMVTDLATAHEDEELSSVVNTMLSRNVSSVLVVDNDGILKGIITERDVLYAILAPK
jgi:CBS domain-containing protein